MSLCTLLSKDGTDLYYGKKWFVFTVTTTFFYEPFHTSCEAHYFLFLLAENQEIIFASPCIIVIPWLLLVQYLVSTYLQPANKGGKPGSGAKRSLSIVLRISVQWEQYHIKRKINCKLRCTKRWRHCILHNKETNRLVSWLFGWLDVWCLTNVAFKKAHANSQ